MNATNRAIARHIAKQRADWPADLQAKAERAVLALRLIGRPDNSDEINQQLNRRELQAFVEAYAAFR